MHFQSIALKLYAQIMNLLKIFMILSNSALPSTVPNYVKEGIFDKRIFKQISSIFNLREKADYEDFFIACAEDVRYSLEKQMPYCT